MKVVKRINTNAAIAVDSTGNEVVILGKGVGFPQVPYELNDLSRVERTFYDIDPKYISMIAEVPQSIFHVSAEIADQAELELKCELNPNLPFTLADHMNFAITRIQRGIDIPMPLSYDIKYLYPIESSLGYRALNLLEQYASVKLPEDEAYSIAMHIINAEVESGKLEKSLDTVNLIQDVEDIIEANYHVSLDKSTYSFSRFIMHLRYLTQRLSTGKQIDQKIEKSVLNEVARECPDAYICARSIVKYLQDYFECDCTDEETLYLTMHVHRLYSKEL